MARDQQKPLRAFFEEAAKIFSQLVANYTPLGIISALNRQAEQDRKMAEYDYQVDLETQRQLEDIYRKINSLQTMLASVASEMTPDQRAALGITEDLLQQMDRDIKGYESPATKITPQFP